MTDRDHIISQVRAKLSIGLPFKIKDGGVEYTLATTENVRRMQRQCGITKERAIRIVANDVADSLLEE